jgi:hypothetical protein
MLPTQSDFLDWVQRKLGEFADSKRSDLTQESMFSTGDSEKVHEITHTFFMLHLVDKLSTPIHSSLSNLKVPEIMSSILSS